jgi:serine/threonine protein kinase
MTETQNGAGNWNLKQELPPSLFTDNYLLKHSNGSQIILRELNNMFLQKLSKNDGLVQKYLEEATLSHENYTKIFLNRKEFSPKGEVWRTYAESSGINFFSLIRKIKQQRIEENYAKYFLLQILEIFEELHKKSVFYLTLRQEDLFLHEDAKIKLADYSLANAILKSYSNLDWVKTLNVKCFAPEINSKLCFNDKSEIFNLGVLLFSMVVGGRPFNQMNSTDKLYKYISNKEDDKYWAWVERSAKKCFSSEFKDLVFRMLATDYNERIGIQEIRTHRFLMNIRDIPSKKEVKQFFTSLMNCIKEKRVQSKEEEKCVNATSNSNSSNENNNPNSRETEKEIKRDVRALVDEIIIKIEATIVKHGG